MTNSALVPAGMMKKHKPARVWVQLGKQTAQARKVSPS